MLPVAPPSVSPAPSAIVRIMASAASRMVSIAVEPVSVTALHVLSFQEIRPMKRMPCSR